MKSTPVPVIMYHSIGVVDEKWISRHLTYRWELFQQHLEWLRRMKFHTISLQQLYDHKKSNLNLPPNPVGLTFDDGYLDIWVFAYPFLKKYGFKGTLFVNPEFVSPLKTVRKNLDDVWQDSVTLEDLETKGFLSWEEIKIMEGEGIMDIQSHSMTHTWYFCQDEIIDFHHPGNNKYPWLFWNAFPERKHYFLDENQEHLVPYGTPVYRYGRSLGIRRYFEDEDLTNHLVSFVNKRGDDFFKRQDWRSELFEQIKFYKSTRESKGRHETDEEQRRRFEYELKESKRILEEKLAKKISFLCWPGGAKTALSIKISHEAGYLASTYPSTRTVGKNIFQEDVSKLYRIGPPNVRFKDRMYHLGGLALILQIFSFRGYIPAKVIQKAVRLFYRFAIVLGIKRNGVPIH